VQGNPHARFLGGSGAAMHRSYPTSTSRRFDKPATAEAEGGAA
jgi:hypothetical protein